MAVLAGTAVAQETIPPFTTPAVFEVGAFPYGIAIEDALGGDGYPDVAVAVGQIFAGSVSPQDWTGDPGQIVIFENTGDWGPPTDGLEEIVALTITLPAFTAAAEVAWAQMNPEEDDDWDLVVTATDNFESTAGAWGVYVFLWDSGDYVLSDYEATSYPVRGLVAVDLDADGDTDVATGVDYLDSGTPRDSISVMFNDGYGELGAPTDYDLESSTDEATPTLVAGSFDRTPGGGTFPDLFTGRWGDAIGVSMTNDGGSFTSTAIDGDPCLWAFTGMATGRFTAGKLYDDVAAYNTFDGLLYVIHGVGDGDFSADCSGDEPDDIYIGDESATFLPIGVGSGHINGGTKIDLVVGTGATNDAFVRILLGKGAGEFEYDDQGDYFVDVDDGTDAVEFPFRVLIADMDQDGFGDIITSNHGVTALDGTISVVINTMTTTP